MNINSLLQGDYKEGSKPGEFRVNCPYCIDRVGKEDIKFKMGISTNKNAYHCFRCGAHGSLNGQKDLEFHFSKTFTQTFTQIRDKIKNLNREEKGVLNIDEFTNSISERFTPMAYEYLIKRGFTDHEIAKYGIRVGKEYLSRFSNRIITRWKGRVVFPFFEDGQIIFAVGRSYYGHKEKYLNSFGNKSQIVYGIDSIKQNTPTLLCEGIISAIAASRNSGLPAVSTLGKFATDNQLQKIRSKTQEVIVCLDGDVTENDLNKLLIQLRKFRFKAWVVTLPDGMDPDEVGTDIVKYIEEKKLDDFTFLNRKWG